MGMDVKLCGHGGASEGEVGHGAIDPKAADSNNLQRERRRK